jgi:hypothetical protein
MKFNREKIAALLALLILAVGMKEVVLGVLSPTRGIEVQDPTIPRSAREVLPRKYRTFTEEGDPGRNPFSFSEGWERLDRAPMEAPPLPTLPRPLALLGASPPPSLVGFIEVSALPAEPAAGATEGAGEDRAAAPGEEPK